MSKDKQPKDPAVQGNEIKTAADLKQDENNYRKHSDTNKARIRKSIDEAGLGRSVVIDADGVLIAGNGVQQVIDKDTPVRVVETDGTELVVVKRTDLHTDDPRRKTLALADNATADDVEWDFEAVLGEFEVEELQDWGVMDDVTSSEQEGVSLEDLGIETISNKGESKSGMSSITFVFTIEAATLVNAWIEKNSKELLSAKIVELCQDAEAK